ncbi:MAG: DUF2569 family protein [Bradyrhizobiaceae bacterium]|nr:MAG: DUF2569 family protein [Bradyrhizobiaceae bacterium]
MSALGYENGLYDKIGGWLILPAFLHPVIGMIVNIKEAVDDFSVHAEKLTSEVQIFLMVNAILCLIMAAAWGCSLYFASTLNRIFPSFYAWLNAINVVVGGLILLFIVQKFGAAPTPEDYADFSKNVLAAIIWIPYILVSKRVKATFYGIPMPARPINSHVGYLARTPEYIEQKEQRKMELSNLSMLQRFGMVVYWFFCVVAALCVGIGVFAAANTNQAAPFFLSIICAFIAWLIGRAVKFIILGK